MQIKKLPFKLDQVDHLLFLHTVQLPLAAVVAWGRPDLLSVDIEDDFAEWLLILQMLSF